MLKEEHIYMSTQWEYGLKQLFLPGYWWNKYISHTGVVELMLKDGCIWDVYKYFFFHCSIVFLLENSHYFQVLFLFYCELQRKHKQEKECLNCVYISFDFCLLFADICLREMGEVGCKFFFIWSKYLIYMTYDA